MMVSTDTHCKAWSDCWKLLDPLQLLLQQSISTLTSFSVVSLLSLPTKMRGPERGSRLLFTLLYPPWERASGLPHQHSFQLSGSGHRCRHAWLVCCGYERSGSNGPQQNPCSNSPSGLRHRPCYGNAPSASLPTDSSAASLWIPWKPAHLPSRLLHPSPSGSGATGAALERAIRPGLL